MNVIIRIWGKNSQSTRRIGIFYRIRLHSTQRTSGITEDVIAIFAPGQNQTAAITLRLPVALPGQKTRKTVELRAGPQYVSVVIDWYSSGSVRLKYRRGSAPISAIDWQLQYVLA